MPKSSSFAEVRRKTRFQKHVENPALNVIIKNHYARVCFFHKNTELMFRKNKSCCRYFIKTVKYNYKDKFMIPTFKNKFRTLPPNQRL